MFSSLLDVLGWGPEVDDGSDFEVVHETLAVGGCCCIRAGTSEEEAGFDKLSVSDVVDILADIPEIQDSFESSAAILARHRIVLVPKHCGVAGAAE